MLNHLYCLVEGSKDQYFAFSKICVPCEAGRKNRPLSIAVGLKNLRIVNGHWVQCCTPKVCPFNAVGRPHQGRCPRDVGITIRRCANGIPTAIDGATALRSNRFCAFSLLLYTLFHSARVYDIQKKGDISTISPFLRRPQRRHVSVFFNFSDLK